MKNLVVFANCQSHALAKTILSSPEFSATYRWDKIPFVQNLGRNDISLVIDKVKQADLFIYQPVHHSPKRPNELTSKALLNHLNDNAQAFSFPSVYFDGYFPHLKTLNSWSSQLNLVHDYFIAYGCAIGLTEIELLSLLQKPNLYPKKVSNILAEKSLSNLKKREKVDQIDIKVAKYIENNYKKRKLFNQFNHPKHEIFSFIARGILKRIGLNPDQILKEGTTFLDQISTPIYSSTHKNLGLKFKEDFNHYIVQENNRLQQLTIIKKFYHFYRTKDLAAINNIVIKKKPFVAKILDSYR